MNHSEPSRDEQIRQTGSVTVGTPNDGPLIHCLTIIGQIEGHYTLSQQNKTTKYEHVIPQLVAIEESPDIAALLIVLNTVGGDVEAGLAIAELIAGMKKPTVSLVLGGGHSIGVPLAVSARRSFIVPSATMTIHPVRMNGLVLGIPQTFSYFERMQDRIVNFVANNSHLSADRMRTLMMETGEMATDVGTVLDGEHAVEEGLIDELGGLSDAIACLHAMIGGEKNGRENACGKGTGSRKSAGKDGEKSGRGRRAGKKSADGVLAAESDGSASRSQAEAEAEDLTDSGSAGASGAATGPFRTVYCPFSGLGNGGQMTCGGGVLPYPPEGKDPSWDGTPCDEGGNR